MLTLLESKKQPGGTVQRDAIIDIYASESDILRVMGFRDIAGNAYKYNQEKTLPGVGFRKVNAGYTESTGVINPETEALVIAGGDLDVDKFIVDTEGEGQRAVQEAMKAKMLAHTIGNTFIKGDSETTEAEFDGLQKRLAGNQLIAAGSTASGDALSLAKLDELIDAVDGANFLYMSKAMRRLLTSAARATGVSGFITYDKDEFGRQIAMYGDLPILLADRNGDVFSTLAFNEACPGGGSAVGTSIYALNISEGMLQGIQSGMMDVRDLGELESKPTMRTRIEWYISLLLEHPRAAARLWGIKNAAVVA